MKITAKYTPTSKGKLFLSTIILLTVPIFCQNTFSQIPAEIQKSDLFQLGYLDVTLMGADSTGRKISTKAIQQAVNLARDNDLVCYFPSGTYLVDDTIKCMKKSRYNGSQWVEERHYCVLVGSAKKRPLIKLVPNAPAFQNSEKPVPVFWFWSMYFFGGNGPKTCMDGSTDPNCNEANISYNQSFRSIDIDLGGNPGAIGIKHAAAQGSTIEDVKINAKGSYAGLFNPTGGVAGGTINVEITGGKYAIYFLGREFHYGGYVNQSNFPTLIGCVFKNQEVAVFHFDMINPMIMAGFHIVIDKGIFNDALKSPGINFVDGIIEMKEGQFINGAINFYMKNVYVKGAQSVVNNWKIDNPASWTRVNEYSNCASGSSNLINGTLNQDEFKSKTENVSIDVKKLAAELRYKHIWKPGALPHFESQGVVNVKNSAQMNGKPALGDGITDDTEALEFAVSKFDQIFLPKGNYKISRPLVLKSNTQIFGVHRIYSRINGAAIQTVNDPDAKSSLSFLSCREINWKAGKNSILRSISPGTIRIDQNGGGRWYAIFNVGSQTFIEGTNQPLAMYGYNPERAADPMTEIKNSENVYLYSVKTEAGVTGNGNSREHNTTIRIINSKNISVYTCSGNITLSNKKGMVEIIDSNDILVTHGSSAKSGNEWNQIKEIINSQETAIPANIWLATYKRGNPDGK
jgi:hypothetical protein